MADTAAAPTANRSEGEQIELEDSLVAYCESHADTTPADLLRAFNVRCYLWPRLTSAERDAGTVVPDERVADCSQDELVTCLANWIRLREAEQAFQRALAAAERVVVVHGSISSNAMRALAALAPSSDAERPVKRRRGDEVDARDTAADEARPPSMAVRSLDAREARSHGRHLRQSGYCVLPSLVSGDLDAWIRRRHLPRELSFYPNWKSSDFFHNADSEPPIPLSGDLEPLRALLPGIEAAASSIAGERLVCLQANATLYSAATNAQLGDHKDGSPFSVVVHVSASRPETAGLIFNEELVRFSEPGHAVLLRGDEYTHRSCAVDEGQDRLVLVFFLDFASASRAAHPRPPASAREVSFHAPDAGAPLADALRAADLTLVVGCTPPELATPGKVAAFRASVQSADFVFGEGPLERVLGHAVGTY
jgi:hypothetical protein